MKLTKAPKGYKAFYISHYGRHGSRNAWARDSYPWLMKEFGALREAGLLTPEGEKTFDQIKEIVDLHAGMDGRLTPRGAEEHRQIAGRMFRNFPQVFKGDARVDAKSTVIIRCILSMESFCMRLKELNPKLRITNDASEHDMYYMNNQDPDKFFHKITSDPKNSEILREYRKKVFTPDRLVKSLVKDESCFTDKYTASSLFYDVTELAISLPNTDLDISLMDVVTLQDMHQLNLYRNLGSYRYAGFCDMGQKVTPFRQTYLLKNIIQTADKAIAEAGTDGRKSAGATLRFGHDSNLMPLCSLMDIDGAGVYEPNNDNVANVWNMEHYIPKAGNLQFVFYGKKGSPVLVKVLLNEHEATLPVETNKFPYYEWNKVREFYLNSLDNSPIKERFE